MENSPKSNRFEDLFGMKIPSVYNPPVLLGKAESECEHSRGILILNSFDESCLTLTACINIPEASSSSLSSSSISSGAIHPLPEFSSSLWKLSLSDAVIRNHFENQVGIIDETCFAIKTYAHFIADALRRGCKLMYHDMQQDQPQESLDLLLDYGDYQGEFKLCLVQKGVEKSAYEMMVNLIECLGDDRFIEIKRPQRRSDISLPPTSAPERKESKSSAGESKATEKKVKKPIKRGGGIQLIPGPQQKARKI